MLHEQPATRLQEEIQKLMNESTERWAEMHHSAIEVTIREQIRSFVARGVPAEDLELVEHYRVEEYNNTVISYYIRIRPEVGT